VSDILSEYPTLQTVVGDVWFRPVGLCPHANARPIFFSSFLSEAIGLFGIVFLPSVQSPLSGLAVSQIVPNQSRRCAPPVFTVS
jgi:hypothetical protein